MFPVLLKIGSLTIFTYGFILALAFLAAIAVAGAEARRVGLPSGRIYDLCFYSIIAALLGARLFHVLLEWPHFRAHPLDVVKLWDGGLAFQGGLVLGVIAALIYIRRQGLPVWKTLDTLALGMPLGQGIGRLGCFMAGCCYGKPTDLPWGVTFTHPESLAPLGVKIHPTQVYESLLVLGIFVFLYRWRFRKQFDGQLLALYFLLAGLARFVVEFFRGDPRGPALLAGMPSTQVIALAIAVIGGGILLCQKAKKNT
ncbi:MAG: prolipoprotein diacylglyceryl transferase [Thermodesulfobacteriota bacterium]